jgi:hypothetical protein
MHSPCCTALLKHGYQEFAHGVLRIDTTLDNIQKAMCMYPWAKPHRHVYTYTYTYTRTYASGDWISACVALHRCSDTCEVPKQHWKHPKQHWFPTTLKTSQN